MNKEKLKGYWEKVKETLGKVSKKIWILIAAIVVVLVLAVVIFINTRPYATLITGATDDEFATVISWLQEKGVTDYKAEGSNTILVPEGQALSLKAQLLQEQYSSSNSAWTGYFERVSALSTMRDRDATWLITLMEAAEQTIRKYPGVRDVDVVINPGEDNGYVLDSGNVVNASADVTLIMEQNKLLTAGQAESIRYMMSHTVAGLNMDDVSIHDTNGNIYDAAFINGDGTSVDSTALALQTEQYWNNMILTALQNQLYKVYGEDNVSIAVHSTVELGDKTINRYEVELPEFAEEDGSGAGIIGSRFYSYQLQVDDDYVVGGVVGTPSNSQLPTYVEEGENLGDVINRLVGEGSIEYDNSKTQTTMVISCATLKDVTVSVFINSEPVSGPRSFSDEELDRLSVQLARSAGITAPLELEDGMTEGDYLGRYVSVMATAFEPKEVPTPEPTFMDTLEAIGIPPWAFFAAIGGLLLFIIILVTVILLVRRSKKKKQEAEQKAIEELMATAMPGETTVVIGEDGQPVTVTLDENGNPVETPVELDENGNPVSGADVMDLHTERSMELRQSIRDFVDENMEVAALLIKSWMKEDGDNG